MVACYHVFACFHVSAICSPPNPCPPPPVAAQQSHRRAACRLPLHRVPLRDRRRVVDPCHPRPHRRPAHRRGLQQLLIHRQHGVELGRRHLRRALWGAAPRELHVPRQHRAVRRRRGRRGRRAGRLLAAPHHRARQCRRPALRRHRCAVQVDCRCRGP